jgi:phage-related protein
MANSFSFNSVDMSAYGLRPRAYGEPFSQDTPSVQLLDRAYPLGSLRPARPISLDVVIAAVDFSTLLSYLDSIKSALNQRTDKVLKIDSITDRYWNVRFVDMVKSKMTAKTWEGAINFIANDPAAYDNSATTSGPTTIDADPHEVTLTVAGTEKTFPVYTLTADATLTATTVGIENEATGEKIEWTGDLVATDVLVIDTATCLIKLNGVEDMLTVEGEFPSLLVGSNILNISGFSGAITTVYRKRYV